MSFLSEKEEQWTKVKEQMVKIKKVSHISELVTHSGLVSFHGQEFEVNQIEKEGANKVNSSGFTTEKCLIRLYD